jgi:hypothetical protein
LTYYYTRFGGVLDTTGDLDGYCFTVADYTFAMGLGFWNTGDLFLIAGAEFEEFLELKEFLLEFGELRLYPLLEALL